MQAKPNSADCQATDPQYQVDYIVIGAGSAGSAIAHRLIETGNYRVLLLEAGDETHWLSRVPVSFAYFMKRPGVNWLYSSEPEPTTGGRRLPIPRGKMIGGSSAINGMVWARGQPQDFDAWARLGIRGWSYRDVLPIFKRMESYVGGDDEYRGRSGPMRISDVTVADEFERSFIAAAEQAGMRYNSDYNGADQEGVAKTQASISGGRRMSTAYCYLDPIRGNRNLEIETGAQAEQLVLEGKRCVGVRYRVGNEVRHARAAREVILSAGAIGSPQLLELSGIGHPDHLRSVGIEALHALPGVGENLRDHYAPRMKWLVKPLGITFNERARGLRGLGQGLNYIIGQKGFLSMPASNLRAFFKSREGLASPDCYLCLQQFLVTPDLKLDKRPGICIITHQLRPESKGSIHITSPHASIYPSVKYNFLADQVDRDAVVACVRTVRKVMASPALAWLGATPIQHGDDTDSDAEILDFVMRTAETLYHPVGTCKMGTDNDPLAVVDDQLRVRGLQGLRVADASIMPTLTSGHINAPSIMIGEKCAAMIIDATEPSLR